MSEALDHNILILLSVNLILKKCNCFWAFLKMVWRRCEAEAGGAGERAPAAGVAIGEKLYALVFNA